MSEMEKYSEETLEMDLDDPRLDVDGEDAQERVPSLSPWSTLPWRPSPDAVPEQGLATYAHFMTDRILLKPEVEEGEERKTDGGIFVSAAALPVGHIVEPEHLAGRRVIYRKYHGDKVVLDGETYVIINPEYVLMFVKDETGVEEVESA